MAGGGRGDDRPNGKGQGGGISAEGEKENTRGNNDRRWSPLGLTERLLADQEVLQEQSGANRRSRGHCEPTKAEDTGNWLWKSLRATKRSLIKSPLWMLL